MMTGRRGRRPVLTGTGSANQMAPSAVAPGTAARVPGQQLPVPKPATSRVVLKAARTAGFRHRRQLRPIWGALAAWITGASAHLAHAGVPVTITVALIAATCFMVDLRRNKRRAGLRFYLAVVDLAAVWLVSAAAIDGPGSRAEGLAIMGTTLAAFPYWWRHRQLFNEPDPEPEPDSPLPEQEAAEIWKEFVACAGGAIPGSRLENPQQVTGGVAFDVILRRGAAPASAALAQAERISSAYEETAENTILDKHESAQTNKLRFTLFTENPLHCARGWEGPTCDKATGQITLGVHATGDPAIFRLWSEQGNGFAGGAVHSLICGTTGSGKSQIMLLIALEALASGRAILWASDLQNGASIPAVLPVAHRPALGADQTMAMLRAAIAILDARSTWMGANGVSTLMPTPEWPLYLIMIDEAQKLLKDPVRGQEARRLLEEIAQTGRKCAVALVLSTQVPELAELGGSEVLRSMLQSGNIVCCRTAGKMSADRAFQGILSVDPSLIPVRFRNGSGSAGTCYIAGMAGSAAPARAWLVARNDDEARKVTAHWARFAAAPDALSEEAARGSDGAAAGSFIPGTADAAGLVPVIAVPAPALGSRPLSFGAEEVVLETLRREGRHMTPAELSAAHGWAVNEWGLPKKYGSRSVGDALSRLRAAGRVCQDGERAPYYLPGPAEKATETEEVNA